MRVTNLVAREHLRPDVILPSVTGQSEFRGNKSEHALQEDCLHDNGRRDRRQVRGVEPNPEEGCLGHGTN